MFVAPFFIYHSITLRNKGKRKSPLVFMERAPGVYFMKLFQNLFLDAPDLPSSDNNCCGNGGCNIPAVIKT